MKKIAAILFLIYLGTSTKSFAQTQEAEQLLLNVEKLSQLKQILQDMKKGYTIISTGYNGIKNISQGNFNLHKTFLDGLLTVSPNVRNYRKVAEIIHYQMLIVKDYKYAYNRFKLDKNFSPEEIEYLYQVYTNLFNQSLKNLDALTTIVKANQLRMSDEERLQGIDAIFTDIQDKFLFLKHFNNSTTLLAVQRAREKKDVTTIQQIYGLVN